MPHPNHPFFAGLRPTLHVAHRGGAAIAPENTMTAFRLAVSRHQPDMIELDVHATRDGVLVVSHDDALARCTDGSGTIARSSWAELQCVDAGYRFTPDGGRTFPFRGTGVRIPMLEEALQEFASLRFNIELKADAPGLADLLAACIRKCKAAARVCVGSELDSVAGRIVAALPEACHFYPREALTALVIALRTGAPWDGNEPFLVLDMPLEFGGVRLIDRPFLDAVSRLGRWVNVWTVDDPSEMARLVGEGVGGIMTDRPDLLRDVLNASR